MYHAKDGLCFERRGDGSVRVFIGADVSVIMDPDTWASAVAAVSRFGEDAVRHETILTFHGIGPAATEEELQCLKEARIG
jgi:hypothetical protein